MLHQHELGGSVQVGVSSLTDSDTGVDYAAPIGPLYTWIQTQVIEHSEWRVPPDPILDDLSRRLDKIRRRGRLPQ